MSKESKKTVSFTKKEVQKYLDECIKFWRRERDENNSKIAVYYIDAFQSVRISIFGKLLLSEK